MREPPDAGAGCDQVTLPGKVESGISVCTGTVVRKVKGAASVRGRPPSFEGLLGGPDGVVDQHSAYELRGDGLPFGEVLALHHLEVAVLL